MSDLEYKDEQKKLSNYMKYKESLDTTEKVLNNVTEDISILGALKSYIVKPFVYLFGMGFISVLLESIFSTSVDDYYFTLVFLLFVLHTFSEIYMLTKKKRIKSFMPLDNWFLVPKFIYLKYKKERLGILVDINPIKKLSTNTEDNTLTKSGNMERDYLLYTESEEYLQLVEIKESNNILNFLNSLDYSRMDGVPEVYKKTNFYMLENISDRLTLASRKQLPIPNLVILLQFSNEIYYLNKVFGSILEEQDELKLKIKIDTLLDDKLINYIENLQKSFEEKEAELERNKIRIKELEAKNEVLEVEQLKDLMFSLEKTRV